MRSTVSDSSGFPENEEARHEPAETGSDTALRVRAVVPAAGAGAMPGPDTDAGPGAGPGAGVGPVPGPVGGDTVLRAGSEWDLRSGPEAGVGPVPGPVGGDTVLRAGSEWDLGSGPEAGAVARARPETSQDGMVCEPESGDGRARGMVPGPGAGPGADPESAHGAGPEAATGGGTLRTEPGRALTGSADSALSAGSGGAGEKGAGNPVPVADAPGVPDASTVPNPSITPDAPSVPAPGGSLRSGDDGDTWWDTAGRRHPVIANETTASIPVHLLFRDDRDSQYDLEYRPESRDTRDTRERPDAAPRRATGIRRPPVPRSSQVQAPTRPAPPVDPRLVERPGPVLPGWVALLTGAAGTGAGLATLWWSGALPAAALARLGIGARPYDGIGIGTWAVLALLVIVVLFALGGLGRGRVGYASVLTLFGDYRGSARRTGLIWVSPLLLRRHVDVRLRHWRSEPLPAVDAGGAPLRVVVLVVWRVKDTARAALGVARHEEYLREQVEAAVARVLSQLPADAFHEETHTLRDAEAVGDALTRMLKADCAPVGIEVYSAQPTGIEYAPEVAAAMRRCRVAAIDAKHRDSVLTTVVDAVDDTVSRLTSRGLVDPDDYERKALVRDLTVAFYTGHSAGDKA